MQMLRDIWSRTGTVANLETSTEDPNAGSIHWSILRFQLLSLVRCLNFTVARRAFVLQTFWQMKQLASWSKCLEWIRVTILLTSRSWCAFFRNVTSSPGPDMISMQTVYFACSEGMSSSRAVFLGLTMRMSSMCNIKQSPVGWAQHGWVRLVFDHFQAAVSKKLHQIFVPKKATITLTW